MPYLILLIDTESKTSEILATPADAGVAAKLRQHILTQVSEPVKKSPVLKLKVGPKGRPVSVISVSDECQGSGIKAGDAFDTAHDASVALGFKYNAVSTALRTASGIGEQSAIVAGVEFQYTDTIEAHD